jgi:orotate phosphoribosyltransferase
LNGPVSSALPSRRGHFLLESGYHTDQWLDLGAIFVAPETIAPLIAALADRLRAHDVSAVCGPMIGGAFLAQALATALGVSFYYTEPGEAKADLGLFAATYVLPPEQRSRVKGQSVAVVDDVISAGSSVRATAAALSEAGASVAVVAALLVLGDAAKTHFAGRRIPVEMLEERDLVLWEPRDCPLCRSGSALEEPRTSSSPKRAQRGPRALVQEFYAEIWNRHDTSWIPRLVTPDFAFRGSLGPSLIGEDAFRSYVDMIHSALGGYRCDILDLVVEGNRAFARMCFSGIHRGDLLGHPATGKPVEWAGAALFTFRSGRIAELWVLGDVHGLRQQLAQG